MEDTTQQHLAAVRESSPGLWIIVASFIALCLLYRQLAPRFPTGKQRSWILTAISSAIMTVASIPFVLDYISGGGSVIDVRTNSLLAIPMHRYFQAHLLADLTMGAFYYREQVQLLTGWIHHVVYVLIVEMAMRWSWTPIFCLCACMELPTFILAIASLYPRLRSDALFALSFFATRIMLHIVLIISYLLPHNRAQTTGGTVLPSIVLTCLFPLHALWFHGCIMGFVKRAKAMSAKTPHTIVNDMASEMAPAVLTNSSSDAAPARHPTMTVPGSFALPPLRLRLATQRSPKHRRRSVREVFPASGNLRTRSLERA